MLNEIYNNMCHIMFGGVIISRPNDYTADIYVQKTINTFWQSYYSLDNTAMPHLGLPFNIEIYLHKSACLPTLLFRAEIMFWSDKLFKKMGSSNRYKKSNLNNFNMFNTSWPRLGLLLNARSL